MQPKNFIPVSRPAISKQDITAVTETLSKTYVAGGPQLPAFEQAIAAYCGRKYAVAVSNATSALYIALRALQFPPGSKILLPSFTIVSLLHAVILCGHTPVFIDVNKSTWNVTLEDIKKVLHKKIAAAIIPETYASAGPMSEIEEIFKKHKIPLIEDAAEGFGGSYKGKKFGSFGDISVLSFYANKLITTGEGGIVLSDDKNIYERCMSLRNLCFDKERRFIHNDVSGNYRMTNLQAALGLSQFSRIITFYAHRKRLYNLYLKLLVPLEESCITFQTIPKEVESSYWVFPVLLKANSFKATDVINRLQKGGVESRHFFYPLSDQPFLKGEKSESPVSISLWKKGLYLPVGNGISEEDVRTSSNTIIHVLKGN